VDVRAFSPARQKSFLSDFFPSSHPLNCPICSSAVGDRIIRFDAPLFLLPPALRSPLDRRKRHTFFVPFLRLPPRYKPFACLFLLPSSAAAQGLSAFCSLFSSPPPLIGIRLPLFEVARSARGATRSLCRPSSLSRPFLLYVCALNLRPRQRFSSAPLHFFYRRATSRGTPGLALR